MQAVETETLGQQTHMAMLLAHLLNRMMLQQLYYPQAEEEARLHYSLVTGNLSSDRLQCI